MALIAASVFIPVLRTSNVVRAAELPSSSYTLTTVPTINNTLLTVQSMVKGNFTFKPLTNSTTQQR